MPYHALGEKPFPDKQPTSPLTLLQPFPRVLSKCAGISPTTHCNFSCKWWRAALCSKSRLCWALPGVFLSLHLDTSGLKPHQPNPTSCLQTKLRDVTESLASKLSATSAFSPTGKGRQRFCCSLLEGRVWRRWYLVSWLGTHHRHAVVSFPQQDPEGVQLPLE